jgi:hypothetical protein
MKLENTVSRREADANVKCSILDQRARHNVLRKCTPRLHHWCPTDNASHWYTAAPPEHRIMVVRLRQRKSRETEATLPR